MKPIRIDNWKTVSLSPYTAPERGIRICGRVAPGEDPRKPEGSYISTSRVASAHGRDVFTDSGTHYVLGEIDPEFREWLREHRPDWDENNPIRLV